MKSSIINRFLAKTKKDKTHIANVRNEIGVMTTDPMDIKMIIRVLQTILHP